MNILELIVIGVWLFTKLFKVPSQKKCFNDIEKYKIFDSFRKEKK